MSDSLCFEQIARKRRAIRSKIRIFRMFLTVFTLFCQRTNPSRCSLLICSFLKSDLSDLLPSLFTKERPERFAQVAHDKRATVSDSLRLLMTKELKINQLQHKLIKTSEQLKKTMSKFPTMAECKASSHLPQLPVALCEHFVTLSTINSFYSILTVMWNILFLQALLAAVPLSYLHPLVILLLLVQICHPLLGPGAQITSCPLLGKPL